MPRRRKRTTETLFCPEHLRNEPVPMSVAAEIARIHPANMWRAIQSGRVRGIPWPNGEREQYWVRLGDLVAFMGESLSPEWQQFVEERLAWTPGTKTARVA